MPEHVDGLRNKIHDFLKTHHPVVTVRKVMRIMDGFSSVENFCNAGKDELLNRYHAARPGSKVDIGRTCYKVIDDVRAFVREERLKSEIERKEKEAAEKEAMAAREAMAKAAEEAERRENPKYTLAEIKAIEAMMELCGIKTIDLKTIKSFMKAVDFGKEDGNGMQPV